MNFNRNINQSILKPICGIQSIILNKLLLLNNLRLFNRLTFVMLAGLVAIGAFADEHNHGKKSSEKPALPDEMYSDAPKGARVYFLSPQDGSVVPQTFTVKFGLYGMGVAPAGVDKKNTGHHHLLIDVKDMPDLTLPLPSSDNIVHFGGGQTETMITLPSGEHTLQLLLGNHFHVPHKTPVMSKKITVTVVNEK